MNGRVLRWQVSDCVAAMMKVQVNLMTLQLSYTTTQTKSNSAVSKTSPSRELTYCIAKKDTSEASRMWGELAIRTTDKGIKNKFGIREFVIRQGSGTGAWTRVRSECCTHTGLKRAIIWAVGTAKLVFLAHMGGWRVGKIIIQETDGRMFQLGCELERSTREGS